MSKINFADSRT